MTQDEAAFLEMLDALWEVYRMGDADMRAWLRVQLRRAVPELTQLDALKKTA